MKVECFVCLVVVTVSGAVACGAGPACFQGLGDLPGGSTASYAYGISGDGAVAVGQGESASGTEAFRWTAGAIAGLGDLPGGAYLSTAYDASADGAVVVGFSKSSLSNIGEAFRWTGTDLGTDPDADLGDLPGGSTYSYGHGVSDNGTVVVGYSGSTSGIEAFRWTQTGGMVGMGDLPGDMFYSIAYGVSGDGSVTVGYSYSTLGAEAFRATGGTIGTGDGLGDLVGGSFYSIAWDVSGDGAVVAGYSFSGSGTEAFRWTQAGGMVGLGDLPGGDFYSYAYGTSYDGSVVVGYSKSGSGTEAFVWDADNNDMRSLRDILVNDCGFDLTGWTLRIARDVSDDGLTIVGEGFNPSGQPEAWIATIPQPGDADLNGAVIDADLSILLSNWDQTGKAWTDGDFNHDGEVSDADLSLLLSNWGAGVTATVPEPAAMALLTVGALNLLRRRRD